MTRARLKKVECSICERVDVFSAELEASEASRLAPKFALAAGWIHPGGEWICPACAASAKARLDLMTREQERAFKTAISEAIYYGRIEVHGVS